MKMHKDRKKKINTAETILAEGVLLHVEDMREEEPRIHTLLLKGFLVYLIVMGEIGCLLTSLDFSCEWLVIHMGVLLGSVFCSLLYYSQKWQNIGYVLLLFVMLASAVCLRRYISSGVFAIVNEISRKAAIFFGNSARKGYVEQITNRSITIPVAMCYVGWAAAILMNVLISRRMRYVTAGFLCMIILFIPLYLEREPGILYMLMLSAGLLLVLVFRKNGHFGLSMQNQRYLCGTGKRSGGMFFGRKKDRGFQPALSYVYAGRTMFHTMVIVITVSFVLICLFGVFLPKTDYARMRSTSAMKEGTMDVVENFTLLGIMGLFNRYPSTGGLSGGTLGGVSAVRLDYETDLTVTYAPYSMDRLYLKSFTGAIYLPRQNRWQTLTDAGELSEAEREISEAERKLNKKIFGSGEDVVAKGRMKVTNVDAKAGMYLPYYSQDVDKVVVPGNTEEYEYYRVNEEAPYLVHDMIGSVEYWRVPRENEGEIAHFCKEAGLEIGESIDTAVAKLRDYFQKNYPYTTRPGATPYQKDFVNYFLKENRKGYCAHFASAATLIFRYLKIPARYVEGYVIDPLNISEDGTVLPDEKYEDYYDGESSLGETAVVSVDVTDASAHAWVEVYDDSRGWYVAEVTPASMSMEGSDGGILQRFLDFLIRDAGNGDAQTTETDQNLTALEMGSDQMASFGKYAGIIFVILAVTVLMIFLGRVVVRWLIWYHRYRNADCSDRLIMRYHNYIQQQCRRDRELAEEINYRGQLKWLVSQGICQMGEGELGRAAVILERAGFSSEAITEEELEWMLGKMGKRHHI